MLKGFYAKLIVIAEMEEYWEHPDLILLRLVREGFLAPPMLKRGGVKMPADYLITIRTQVKFLKRVKAIFDASKAALAEKS